MAEVTGGLILLAIGAYFALPFRLSESMIEWLGPVLLIIVGCVLLFRGMKGKG